MKHLPVIMNKSGYVPAILNLKEQCFKTFKNIFYFNVFYLMHFDFFFYF